MKTFALFFWAGLLVVSLHAQKISVSGKIIDKNSGEKISFATVRASGTLTGTTANLDGLYEIKLNAGTYKLVASCIGYKSDSVAVNLSGGPVTIEFRLTPLAMHLPGILVTPGMNPANPIIKKAIEQKNLRNRSLHSYIYYATSKMIVRAPEELKLNDNSATTKLGYSDTSKMKIGAITENQSKGYYKSPGQFKEEIIARKQTANLPPSVNMLTGGRIIQNFYSDDIKFFNASVEGPLSDDALDYYYFDLLDTLLMDSKKVFKIHMSTIDPLAQGFNGDIYIEENSYNLKQVDLLLKNASAMSSFFDTIHIVQQFLPFGEKNSYMPVDYRLFLSIKYFSLLKININLESVLYEYEINPEISDDLFSRAVVTVSTTADKKDSTYWSTTQAIVSTNEEKGAYLEIDSIKQANKEKKAVFHLYDVDYAFNDSTTFPAPLGMYRFNKIEGHALKAEFSGNGYYDQRLNWNVGYAYGFGDKRWKGKLSADYALGDYRTSRVKVNVFRYLNQQFGSETIDDNIITTAVNLCSKFETDQYMYTDGFNVNFESELSPVLTLKLGYQSKTDATAYTCAPPPLFFKGLEYNSNDPIYAGVFRFFTAGLKFDFRKYVEDGLHRARFGGLDEIPIISLQTTISGAKILRSEADFAMHTLDIQGSLHTLASNTLSYKFAAIYSTGAVPYQYLIPVQGNYDGIFEPNTFRTLRKNIILGDRDAFLNLEYSAGTSVWRLLHISFLQQGNIQLSFFGNAALSRLSDGSRQIALKPAREFLSPVYECGFGLSQPLVPLRLELAWKLNYHTDGSDFRIGINTPLY